MKPVLGGALLSSFGVLGAALAWLVSFKILASWLGPEGVGLFAQLRQIIQTATLGATYGGTNIVVQGLAARNDESSRKRFKVMAAWLIGVTGAGIALLMIIAAPQITWLALSSDDSELIQFVRWLAGAVLINVAATYLMALLNGYRSYGYLALAQVSGPLVLCLFLLVSWQGIRLPHTLAMTISFLVCFGVTCLVSLSGASRLHLPEAVGTQLATRHENFRGLFQFALSSLTAALSTVITLLIIRSWIIASDGLAFSGLFDAGWTLTFNYTTLFLTAANTVYLPALTAAMDAHKQKACIQKTAYLVFGGSVLVSYLLVMLQVPLIHLLYSPQFDQSGQVLSVLAIAVVFRSVSWAYGTLMLATRRARAMLLSELILNIGLLITTRYALDNYGTLASIGWSFVIPHFLYLVFVVEYVRAKNPLIHRRSIWPLLATGVIPLMVMAIFTPDGALLSSQFERLPYIFIGCIAVIWSLWAYKRVMP